MNTEQEHSPWLLQTDPSPWRWHRELAEIVNGAREMDILHFGSPAGYVRSLIFNSRSESEAQTYCAMALRWLVDSWHPLDWPAPERDRRILQLLAAHTPGEGMGKTLVFLRQLNRRDRHGEDAYVQRLKPIALQVMERYFPVEQGPAGAFEEYVEQLEANLAHPDYALYATARLRSLRRLRVVPGMAVLFESDLETLPALVRIFVPGPEPSHDDFDLLSDLYASCLHSQRNVIALRNLRVAIESLGFRLVEDERPRLESAARRNLGKLRLSEGDHQRYDAYKVFRNYHRDSERVRNETKDEGQPVVPMTWQDRPVSAAAAAALYP